MGKLEKINLILFAGKKYSLEFHLLNYPKRIFRTDSSVYNLHNFH
jgi:hypothetical protein